MGFHTSQGIHRCSEACDWISRKPQGLTLTDYRKLDQRETLETPLNRETRETPTYTVEAIMFRGSVGTLFGAAKSQLLGHDLYLCHCEPARLPVWNGTACKGLAANGSATFNESR